MVHDLARQIYQICAWIDRATPSNPGKAHNLLKAVSRHEAGIQRLRNDPAFAPAAEHLSRLLETRRQEAVVSLRTPEALANLMQLCQDWFDPFRIQAEHLSPGRYLIGFRHNVIASMADYNSNWSNKLPDRILLTRGAVSVNGGVLVVCDAPDASVLQSLSAIDRPKWVIPLPTGEEDLVEVVAALWDPQGGTELSDLAACLEVARAIAR